MMMGRGSSFGESLLDKSKANPASVDMSIFEKKKGGSAGAGVGQGSVSSDYLQKTRQDNPDPDSANKTDSVTLSNCKITTDPSKLAAEQPFEMSVEVKGPASSTSGTVTFNLFCCIPKADGTEDCKDLSSPSQGTVKDGTATASGKLAAPDPAVDPGTKLKYYVVAQHPNAPEKSESPKVEVEAGKLASPLAIWSLGAVHFGFDSSFIMPSSADEIAKLKDLFAQHAGAAASVFGHADPVGEDDGNKKLSGRRAYATYCLLTKNADGWIELSKGGDGDKWGLRTTQTILARLKNGDNPWYGGSIDGRTGPKTESAIKGFQKANGLSTDGAVGPLTKAKLYAAYMAEICSVDLKPEDFVGDPADKKRQWACNGCGEFNPLLVFSRTDEDKFRAAKDKAERNAKNAPNRRATVMLFPDTAKGPGNATFPCPAWSEGAGKCKDQFFDDADKRRNPSEAERTWEKDKDTFACRFYAGIGKDESFVPAEKLDGFPVPAQKPYVPQQDELTLESDGGFEPFEVAAADDGLVAQLIDQARKQHDGRRNDSAPKTKPGGDFIGFMVVDKIQTPTIKHDHGFLDDGKGNLDLGKMRPPTWGDRASYLKWMAKLEAAETLLPELHDATFFYRHFMSASGTTLKYDYNEYVGSDRSGQYTVESAVEDARAAAVELNDATPQSGVFLIESSAFGAGGKNRRYPYPGTENWQKAIGAHVLWMEAKVHVEAVGSVRSFRIELTIHAQDMYNFNPGMHDITTGVADAENGVFEVTGQGKEFLSESSIKRNISFTCGLERQPDYRAKPKDLSVKVSR